MHFLLWIFLRFLGECSGMPEDDIKVTHIDKSPSTHKKTETPAYTSGSSIMPDMPAVQRNTVTAKEIKNFL